ncbi:uncharacterized protein LOC134524183 [Chroicocephalus ridibundus]|uniref:uncharacterized protein LOC134524183 n=1 Tax=Chroicocephalus ridibundus TaxID=1192867 RepID=UPI002FDD2005
MQGRKLAVTPGKPAPAPWWLVGGDDLSQRVARCAARTLSPAVRQEDAAETPRASFDTNDAIGINRDLFHTSEGRSSLLLCPTAEVGHFFFISRLSGVSRSFPGAGKEPEGLRGGDRGDRPATNRSTTDLPGPHVSSADLSLEDTAVAGTSWGGRSSVNQSIFGRHIPVLISTAHGSPKQVLASFSVIWSVPPAAPASSFLCRRVSVSLTSRFLPRLPFICVDFLGELLHGSVVSCRGRYPGRRCSVWFSVLPSLLHQFIPQRDEFIPSADQFVPPLPPPGPCTSSRVAPGLQEGWKRRWFGKSRDPGGEELPPRPHPLCRAGSAREEPLGLRE